MRRIALMVSVVLGLASAALAYQDRSSFRERVSGGAPVPVLVAATEIPVGVILTPAMLVTRNIPEKYVEARHIRAAEANQAIGIRTTMGLHPTETILWTDLASSTEEHRVLSGLIKSGMRAVTLALERGARLGGLLRPGDRIDLMLRAEKDGEMVVMPLLQNVLVLAVGSDIGRKEDGLMAVVARGSDLTVSVTVQQAQALMLAQAEGTIAAFLRNPNDILVDRDRPVMTARDIHLKDRRTALQDRETVGRTTPETRAAKTSQKEIEHVR